MGITAKITQISVRQTVMDAWKNAVTGLGTLLKDKRMSAYADYCPLGQREAENLYAGDDVAAKVVDAVPDDGLRQWGAFTSKGDENFDFMMNAAFDALHVRSKFREGWKWGRLYGGGALLMMVDDSQDLSQPLRMEAIRELKSLVPLTRWELQFGQINQDLGSQHFGHPETYRIQPHRGTADVTIAGQEIHRSRLLIFHGCKLPPQLYVENGYWHDSVLTRAQNPIRNYSTAHDAAATIMQEFSQPVFKMKGLAALIQNGNADKVVARLEMMQIARSVCRMPIIDMDETIEAVGAALTGAPDMLRAVGGRLVAASNMPHTKILGESPSGLGATGQSEMSDWDDFVANEQELVAEPNVLRLAEVLLMSKNGPTKGKVPQQWGFEFKPLRQPDETEQATNRYTQAQTDGIYIDRGVIDPDECAKSRFGSGKYSTETTIDARARDRVPPVADPAKTADPAKAPAPAKPAGGAA